MELEQAVAAMLGQQPAGPLDAWLAERDLGLLPIADPAAFEWPGSFLVRQGEGWSVWFGVPPGVLHGEARAGPADEVLVLASHDPQVGLAPAPRGTGVVERIVIAPAAEAAAIAVPRARALPGRGLAGDRYADGAGTFSARGGSGRALTLVAAEVLDDAGIDALEARRNIVVRGIALEALIGRRFRIGEVECAARRRCEPCAHLERLTRPGVLRALARRGGIRADILSEGEIGTGDAVVAL